MKIWLLEEDKFVEINNIKEVSNPIGFEKGMIPTSDGLFSNEIFGMNNYDRRHNWGYIDLKGHYITPKMFITLKALNKNFENVIYGTKNFVIVNGKLEENEDGGTGLEWLYKNWDKISFEKNNSNLRNDRVDAVTNHKRDEIFITKWAVMPAFYRDVSIQNNGAGRPKVQKINDLYASIIRNVAMVNASNSFDILLSAISGKIQQTLVDIYNMMKDKVSGKNGHLRRAILGKSIDYCSRIVITATPYDTESVEDQHINFYYTGVPLSYCCAQLTPFIIWWLKNYFRTNIFSHKDQYPYITDTGETVYIHLDNPEYVFNDEYIEKCLGRWINNPASRFNLIELPVTAEDKAKYKIKNPVYMRFSGYSYETTTMARENVKSGSNSNGILTERPITWTDILYQAAVDVSSDKHVEITRYPMLDYLGTYFSRIYVISTRKTVPMIINGTLYDTYPLINLKTPPGRIEALFIDSYKICPLYLAGLDGDHDGDQITSKMIFTKEANEEIERIMLQKSNIITIDGGSIRTIGNEGIQTLYTLTKFH